MKNALILIGLLLVSTGAFAKSGKQYVGFSYGKSKIDTGVSGNTGTSKLDEEDDGYKLIVGHKYTKNLSVELQYVDFGEASLTGNKGDQFDLDAVTYEFNVDNVVLKSSADSIGISGLYTLDVSKKFIPFAKVGLHRWDSKTTVSGDSISNAEASDSGTDLFYGIGANIGSNSNLSARVEYENFKVDDESVTLLSVGLIYTF